MGGEDYVRLMSAFVSHKPELSENGTCTQWDSQPRPQMTQRLNTFDVAICGSSGWLCLKKKGYFPTPSPIASLPLQQ